MSIINGCRPILGKFQIPNMKKSVQLFKRQRGAHSHIQGETALKNTFSKGAPSENKPTALSLYKPIRFSNLKH